MKGYLILWNHDPRELDTTMTGVPGERSHHSGSGSLGEETQYLGLQVSLT